MLAIELLQLRCRRAEARQTNHEPCGGPFALRELSDEPLPLIIVSTSVRGRHLGRQSHHRDANQENARLAAKTQFKPPLKIRPYQSSDETAVVALWREVFADDPPHHDPAASIRLKMDLQPELFFVAVRGNELVGTIMAGFDGHRGWIYRVAVHLQHQRQGIGTALVRRAESELIARGAPKINLQIRATNSQVVGFYEQLGYAIEERISMGKRIL